MHGGILILTHLWKFMILVHIWQYYDIDPHMVVLRYYATYREDTGMPNQSTATPNSHNQLQW